MNIDRTEPLREVRPVLRWAGSKRKSLGVLASYWKDGYARYVEPFAGSASLFFKLEPKKALLSDINSALIEALEVVRDNPDELHMRVAALPRNRTEYYRMRELDPSQLSVMDRGVRFVYLNRFCFNGIYRTNRDGGFNVPYAHGKPGFVPPVEDFRRCSRLLTAARLKCCDFGSTLSAVREGDFVYIDPPYTVAGRRVFSQYHERQFTEKDLNRLDAHLKSIDRKGAIFVFSYTDSPEARRIGRSWSARRVQVRRNIAGFASARKLSYELVISNSEG